MLRVIRLATLLAPSCLIHMPVAAVLTVLAGSRLQVVPVVVGHIFLLVVIHEAIMLLYRG